MSRVEESYRPPKMNEFLPLKKGPVINGNESSSNHQFAVDMFVFRGHTLEFWEADSILVLLKAL